MNLYKKQKVIFLLLAIIGLAFAKSAYPQSTIDSLKNRLVQNANSPKLYNDLCETLIDSTLAEASSYAEKALQLAKAQGFIIEEARALYHLGDISFRNQKFQSAADYHIQSAKLYQQTEDYMGAALSFNEAGFICHKLDRFDEALGYYKKSIQYLIKLNNTDDLPYLLINIGQIFEKKADYDSALFYYEKAKTLADRPGMEYPMNVIYGNMGIVYKQSGNLQKALENYELALEISKTNNFENAIGADLSNIANVYLEWQNHQMAIKYFSEAIEINRKTNNKAGLSISLNNLASVYKEIRNYDTALVLYQQAAVIDQELGFMGNLAIRQINIGSVYYLLGDYQNALDFMLEGLATSRKLQRTISVAKALQSIGTVYIDNNDFVSAQKYLDEAEAMSLDLGLKQVLSKVYESQSRLNEEAGNSSRALAYHKKFKNLEDSLFTEQSQEKLADMQARYETEKKEQQIKILVKDNQLQKSNLRRKEITLASLGGGLFLFALAAFIIWMMYLQKSRANRKLVEQNLELLKNELDTIEIPAKPANSSLVKDTERERIIAGLEQVMKKQKWFIRDQITLTALCNKLNTNSSYLSHIINDHYQMNFPNYLNHLRIREVQRMLGHEKHKTMTLEGIASSVGFHSKPTFNAAFKKITGVTPSIYIKNMEDIHREEPAATP